MMPGESQNSRPFVMAAPASALPWYAVRVRSNFERNVSSSLRGKGYDEYLPVYCKSSRWSDRVKDVYRPLFPGYVFCQLDIQHRLGVLTTPGVISIVGFGGEFIPVPEEEMRSIRTIANSGLSYAPWEFLREGQRVRIRSTVLDGLEGFVVQLKNDFRVVLSVELLQRSVAVQVDRRCIEPLDRRLVHTYEMAASC